MKITKEIFLKMFENGTAGSVSSTRVMAWKTWVFTKYVIIGFLIVLTTMIMLEGYTEYKVSDVLLNRVVDIYTYTLVALFVAIYTPKSFQVLAEAIAKLWTKDK